MRYFLSFTLILFLLSACSTRGVKTYQYKKTTQLKKYNLQNKTQVPKNIKKRSYALYQEYVKWRNTPYEYGGDSKSGVDCSSFIQQAYYGAFKLAVPRTTRQQARTGYQISKNRLQVGDMVFFKTNYNKRHVGIVIEDGKFVHSSSKKGVTISKLGNKYWQNRYWQSRRVLP
jgi:lipoprotein Spr/probable lipoprotein NlpC